VLHSCSIVASEVYDNRRQVKVTEQVVRTRDGILGIGAGGGMSARGVFRDRESGCRGW
jgi:hypothetical protein